MERGLLFVHRQGPGPFVECSSLFLPTRAPVSLRPVPRTPPHFCTHAPSQVTSQVSSSCPCQPRPHRHPSHVRSPPGTHHRPCTCLRSLRPAPGSPDGQPAGAGACVCLHVSPLGTSPEPALLFLGGCVGLAAWRWPFPPPGRSPLAQEPCTRLSWGSRQVGRTFQQSPCSCTPGTPAYPAVPMPPGRASPPHPALSPACTALPQGAGCALPDHRQAANLSGRGHFLSDEMVLGAGASCVFVVL